MQKLIPLIAAGLLLCGCGPEPPPTPSPETKNRAAEESERRVAEERRQREQTEFITRDPQLVQSAVGKLMDRWHHQDTRLSFGRQDHKLLQRGRARESAERFTATAGVKGSLRCAKILDPEIEE